MRNSDEKEKIIESLVKTPLIGHACKKVGITRMTLHRWMKDNPQFKRKIEAALKLGREHLSEFAESVLLKKIEAEDFKSIKFYLENIDPKFMPKRTVFAPLPKHKHDLEPGDICPQCGTVAPLPRSFEEQKKLYWVIGKEYTPEMYEDYLKDFMNKTPKGRKMWNRIKKGKKKKQDNEKGSEDAQEETDDDTQDDERP